MVTDFYLKIMRFDTVKSIVEELFTTSIECSLSTPSSSAAIFLTASENFGIKLMKRIRVFSDEQILLDYKFEASQNERISMVEYSSDLKSVAYLKRYAVKDKGVMVLKKQAVFLRQTPISEGLGNMEDSLDLDPKFSYRKWIFNENRSVFGFLGVGVEDLDGTTHSREIKIIQLYERQLESSRPVKKLTLMSDFQFEEAQFSKTGDHLFMVNGTTLKIMERNGEIYKEILSAPWDLAFDFIENLNVYERESDISDFSISLSGKNICQLYDIDLTDSRIKLFHELEDIEGDFITIQFYDDHKMVISSSTDDTISIWKLDEGTQKFVVT